MNEWEIIVDEAKKRAGLMLEILAIVDDVELAIVVFESLFGTSVDHNHAIVQQETGYHELEN
jgi:hypothetical protein